MISCQAFRENLRPGSSDPGVLDHLRKCDACLDWAVSIDPDNFFRAIGGQERVPPGGIDAFTDGVMDQIRIRQAEQPASRRFMIPLGRLAAAAVVVVAVGITAIVLDHGPKPQPPVRTQLAAAVPAVPAATKPVVETYQSKDATIVEMPSEGPHDARVVMIFDDSLSADL